MNSFATTLLLVASIAEASNYHGYSHGSPAYSQGTQGQHVHSQYYNPHAKPAVEPFVQPHVNTHRYGSHANKTQYDRRYPDAYGNYNHGGLLPQYQNPHSHLAHRHTQTTDPWGNKDVVVVDETWWSPHRQFSPPLVKYVPAALKSTVYAVCNITPGTYNANVVGQIEIAQDPYRPSTVRIGLDDSAATVVTESFRFDVYTTGDLEMTAGVPTCAVTDAALAMLGDPFHPLLETRNGVVNPYADPERGVIADIPWVTAGFGTDATETVVEKDVLMDLGGVDSLIGRAIIVSKIQDNSVADYKRSSPLYYTTDMAAGTTQNADVVGCCIIAYDSGPASQTPEPTQVWQQSIHTQYHAADPTHEQHTHDAPAYGNDYGNTPAPQTGYGHGHGHGHGQVHSHGGYSSYPQKSHGHGAWY